MCKTDCVMVNREMLNAFVKRWYMETLSFHLPHGQMFITLDDVLCLLHLPIRGKLLDHGNININEALDLVYTDQLLKKEQVIGDDEQVVQHRAYVMRAYKLYLVGMALPFYGQECHFYGCYLPAILQ